MKRMAVAGVFAAAVCAAAQAASAPVGPRWLNVLPLLGEHEEELAADQRELFGSTALDAAAFIVTLTPESDPAFDKAAVYVPRFKRMQALLKGAKGQCGVLFQATIGHGWVPDSKTPWQKIVLPNGSEPYIFCPLGGDFRAYLKRQVTQIAATRPDFFMVDDDTRLVTGRGGCFCPLHLAEMKRRTGRDFTRETLLKAIDAEPAVARAWDKLLEDSIAGVVGTVRAAFDAVDPSIPGEFCCCCGDVRHATRLARLAAAPGQVPVLRLNNGRYCLETARDFPAWQHATALQLAAVPDDVVVLDEPDTCPQNRYSMSAADLHAHLSLALMEGCRGGKFWITRTGTWEPASGLAYRETLRRNRGFHEALAALAPKWEGVRIPLPRNPPLSFACRGAWNAPMSWAWAAFGRFGVAYAFTADDRPVAALAGDDSKRLPDEEIRELLKRGLLLDGNGALELTRRGFGELIGARAEEWSGPVASFELLADGKTRINAKIAAVKFAGLDPAAKIRSTLRHRAAALDDASAEVGAGAYVFKNKLGGTVAVLADKLPESVSLDSFHFLNETRKRQVVALLGELGDKSPYTPSDAEAMVRWGRAKDGTRLLAAFVSGHDDMPELPLVFPAGDAPKALERLQPDGSWAGVPVLSADANHAVVASKIEFLVPAVFRVVR